MKTEFIEENQNYVMTFEGRLDTPASLQVGRDMQVLYDCEGHDIILDCTNLEYITSSGMRLFLDLLKVAKSKGSTLFLYTDGLNEAEDAQNHLFGKKRILEVMQSAPQEPQTLIERMKQAVADFVGDTEQSDDLTMLMIHLPQKPNQ